MIESEVSELFATIAAFDRRETSKVDVMAWQAAFAAAGMPDLSLSDARDAVVQHYATTRQWVMVYDVIARCKQVRRERINAAGNIYALVQADPEDTHAYHAEYQRLHAEIAAGAALPPRLEVL